MGDGRAPLTHCPVLRPPPPFLFLPAALKPRSYGEANVASRVDGAELLERALAEGREAADDDDYEDLLPTEDQVRARVGVCVCVGGGGARVYGGRTAVS